MDFPDMEILDWLKSIVSGVIYIVVLVTGTVIKFLHGLYKENHYSFNIGAFIIPKLDVASVPYNSRVLLEFGKRVVNIEEGYYLIMDGDQEIMINKEEAEDAYKTFSYI